MYFADLGVLAILALSAVVAVFRGFTREVLSVAGWIGAAAVTIYGFGPVRPHARALIGQTMIADIATGLVLFIVSLIIFSVIAQIIGQRVNQSRLGALDRSLGLLFGLARGAFIVVLIYLALGWAWPPPHQPAWLAQARTRPLVEAGAEWLQNLAPPEFRAGGKAAFDEAQKGAKRAEDAARAIRALGGNPSNAPASGSESGYKTDERRQLDRLFQSSQ